MIKELSFRMEDEAENPLGWKGSAARDQEGPAMRDQLHGDWKKVDNKFDTANDKKHKRDCIVTRGHHTYIQDVPLCLCCGSTWLKVHEPSEETTSLTDLKQANATVKQQVCTTTDRVKSIHTECSFICRLLQLYDIQLYDLKSSFIIIHSTF